jgi:hypothetical protein
MRPRAPNRTGPILWPTLLAIALYAVTLKGTYVYDDVTLLIEDPRLRDPAQWHRYLTESYNGNADNLYRPLTSLSYAIQWWLHGDRPWAFHLVNILLHAGVTACVAMLTLRLTRGNRVAALLAGLFFAAHPIHVEAVANIAGRPELLCAIGMFGAILLSLEPMTWKRGLAVIGCTFIAILAKEQGMLIPPMLVALFLARRRAGMREPRCIWPLGALMGMMLIAYLAWRNSILPFAWDRTGVDWVINPLIPSPANRLGGSVGRDAWLMPIILLGRYAALLLVPLRLSPDYGGNVIGCVAHLDDPYLYIGLVTIIAWLLVLLISFRRRSVAGIFLATAIALSYAMVGNIITYIATIFAERLMYLPSAFLLILVASPLSRINPSRLVPLVSVLLVAGIVRTFTYARLWNEPLRLWQFTATEMPLAVKARIHLAHQYMIRREFTKAEQAAEEARKVLPQYSEAWVRSAMIAMEQHKWEAADQYLRQAMRVDPRPYVFDWMVELNKRRAATNPATPQP